MVETITKAVIATGGKQYLVREGGEILVERLSGAKKSVSFTPLAVTKGGALAVPKAPKVQASVLGEAKGDKLVVFKMRAKKQSRKKTGHRQKLTKLRIERISA